MKRFIFVILLSLSSSLSIFGQDFSNLPEYILDSEAIENIIRKETDNPSVSINLLNSPPIIDRDIEKIVCIRNMSIGVDKISDKIEYSIDTDKVLLFFPSKPLSIYTWNNRY